MKKHLVLLSIAAVLFYGGCSEDTSSPLFDGVCTNIVSGFNVDLDSVDNVLRVSTNVTVMSSWRNISETSVSESSSARAIFTRNGISYAVDKVVVNSSELLRLYSVCSGYDEPDDFAFQAPGSEVTWNVQNGIETFDLSTIMPPLVENLNVISMDTVSVSEGLTVTWSTTGDYEVFGWFAYNPSLTTYFDTTIVPPEDSMWQILIDTTNNGSLTFSSSDLHGFPEEGMAELSVYFVKKEYDYSIRENRTLLLTSTHLTLHVALKP